MDGEIISEYAQALVAWFVGIGIPVVIITSIVVMMLRWHDADESVPPSLVITAGYALVGAVWAHALWGIVSITLHALS